MKKQYLTSAWCLLLSLILLLGACGAGDLKDDGPAYVPRVLRTVSADDLGVARLIDAVPADDGYLLLAQISNFGTEWTVITLGNDLSETGRRQADLNTDMFVQEADGAWRPMTASEAKLTDKQFISGQTRAYSADGVLYIYKEAGISRDGVDIGMPAEEDRVYKVKGMMSLSGGTYAVLEEKIARSDAYRWEGTWLCPVDGNTTGLSKAGISVPFEVSACASVGETGWLVGGGDLYSTDGETFTPYADLTAAGINTSEILKLLNTRDNFLVLTQSELVLLAGDGASDGAPDKETGNQTPSGKQVIRMASLWSCYYNKAISQFNRENARYTIENVNYDSAAQMNLALANGEVDLVVSGDYNTIWSYAEKGLLTNLDESTPELFDDGVLVPSVVNALRLGGNCYFLATTFYMASFMLPEEDSRKFADIGDFLDFVDANYPHVKYGPEAALFYILDTYGDTWLDLDTGEACFDSESFAKVLEFCARYPSQYDEELEALYEDDPYPYFNLSFNSALQLGEAERASGEVSYIPVAIPGRNSAGISVRSNCYIGAVKNGNESGAAEFLSWLILSGPFDDIEANNWMPLSVSRLEQYLDGDTVLNKPRYTDYQKDIIREYLPLADHVNGLGVELAQHVIREEARAYFNGDCTLDEAIERVQSRVSTYLAELG